LRGEKRYKEIADQLVAWLVDKEGEGFRKEFILSSNVKPNSLTDVQKELQKSGLIEVESTEKGYLYRLTSKGQEYAATLEAKAIGERYRLPKYVSDYLEKRRSKRITRLWPLQEDYVDIGFRKGQNLFVCSPPASGKTLIAEIEAIRELKKESGKVLYCTPFKALDAQKDKDFRESFSSLGFNVVTTDGDHPSTPQILEKANVVVATYERILMAIKNEEEWLKKLTLLCADEITILDEEDRGSNVDLVLTLMKKKYHIRIVALSTLVGNPHKIKDWLNARLIFSKNTAGTKEEVVYPSGSKIVFLGDDGSERKELLKENENILEHIIENNLRNDDTTIIFLPGRQHAELFAAALSHIHTKYLTPEEADALTEASSEIMRSVEEETPLLQRLVKILRSGIAFHHAGLPFEARRKIEDLLAERKLKTICSTTTLSHGIDYPVDNVVIAFFFVDAKNWEFDRYSYAKKYSYIQIKGRAGRPDKSKGDSHVFLLSRDKEKATDLWQKYLLKGSLEEISSNTCGKENIAKLTLLEANKECGTTAEEILATMMETFDAKTNKKDPKSTLRMVSDVITDLRAFGLIEDEGRLKTTKLGSLVNGLIQSPYDAQLIVKSIFDKRKVSDFGLMYIASSVGFAKNVRNFCVSTAEKKKLESIAKKLNISLKGFLPSPALRSALILTEYIQEEKIGTLTSKYMFFNDNDIYELSKYAARSMYEIARISRRLGRHEIGRRADLLAQRITHGVKEDLLETGIVFLPRIGRTRGRSLLSAGLKSVNDVAKASRLTIIDVARVNAETAIKIQDHAKKAGSKKCAREKRLDVL